jgi:CDP-diacylglycerol--glycerol-3-phosphate 3-phosphatidyltransferase
MPASPALAALRRRWLLLAAAQLLALAAGYRLLTSAAWLLLAAAFATWQLFMLYRDLPLNAPKSGRLRPDFGAGTWLSGLRLIALSLLAGLLALPRPAGELAWLPFALALLFNLSDLFDGYLARRSGVATPLGAKLDLDLDGRGMLVVTLLAVRYGQAAWPFALVGLARYAYVAALWAHRRRGRRLRPAPPNALRRPFAGVQMGVAAALLAPLFAPPATVFVSALTLLPFLGHFFYDWLAVTGRLNLAKMRSEAAHLRKVASVASLLLRLLVCALLFQRAFAGEISRLSTTFDLIAALYLLLGFAGRPLAMLALIISTARLGNAPLAAADYALLAGLLGLMYLGFGRWQLWQPELRLLTRRLADKGRS